MRLLVCSDLHLDATTAGFDRFDDCAEALGHMADIAVNENCDLFLFLGDLCDPTQRAHRCVEFAAGIALGLSQRGVRSRWLVGNHDVIEDGSGTSTLSGMSVLNDVDHFQMDARVVDRPCFEFIGDAGFIFLPFVPRSHAYDPEAFVYSTPATSCERVVVAAHLNIEGIEPGSETSEMPRGRDVFFPLAACREAYGARALLLNGHYHDGQIYEGIHIPGSLERLTFGEECNVPSYLIVEVR